ncbi:glycosyltransferase family protein [Piscirickettsia litoralis]|uniref:Glycosyltransferase subfamily 4-like N-terminal domain-containing protein n=1 Tax=Piscirickettsia litoralis TaxID=1891921 RepID=A0ABX3A953_9GAMM|nr:hypothetical protein [Piscirickettsia litoralis]ODN42659.1 hypothetical protein BGC07_06650 [Piscirickettsia litoralis]
MNILFISKSLTGGGSERVLINIAHMLKERGFTCHILLLNKQIEFEVDSDVSIDTAHCAAKLRFKPIHEICLATKILQLEKKSAALTLYFLTTQPLGKVFSLSL